MELYFASSLQSVFPDKKPDALKSPAFFVQGRKGGLQIVYRVDEPLCEANDRLDVRIDCTVPHALYRVSLVPVRFPCYTDAKGAYLKREPGLFPDVLERVGEDTCLRGYAHLWQSLYLELQPDGQTPPGDYALAVSVSARHTGFLGEAKTKVRVLPPVPRDPGLRHTRWFHMDSLAHHYRVPMLSEAHWALCERFIACAAGHGINMILTPIHTPPLDTREGRSRLTAQLCDIQVTGENQYAFSFDKLDRFVRLCERCGIRYFEMAHLFTQWGAKHAPQIVGEQDGRIVQLFGWETDALSEGYQAFLAQYLPALTAHLSLLGLRGRCYFHLSDEPNADTLPHYLKLKERVEPLLHGYPLLDALSDVRFFDSGAVPLPVPAINHLEAFLDRPLPERWTYYCCGQSGEEPNQFIAQPLPRVRALGVLMYICRLNGFLHWAFNFYLCQYSDYPVDPHFITDGDGFSPAGDCMTVYPGQDGTPQPSIRLKALRDAMLDRDILLHLEQKIGREGVLEKLKAGGVLPSLSAYPLDEDYYLNIAPLALL